MFILGLYQSYRKLFNCCSKSFSSVLLLNSSLLLFLLLRSSFSPFYSVSFLTLLRTPLLILSFLLIFVLCPIFKCLRIMNLFCSCFILFSNLLFVTARNLQFRLIRTHISTLSLILLNSRS